MAFPFLCRRGVRCAKALTVPGCLEKESKMRTACTHVAGTPLKRLLQKPGRGWDALHGLEQLPTGLDQALAQDHPFLEGEAAEVRRNGPPGQSLGVVVDALDCGLQFRVGRAGAGRAPGHGLDFFSHA
jgi:hypothetical protein